MRNALATALLATAFASAPALAEHNRIERISTGPSGGNGQFDTCLTSEEPCADFSDDGSRVFFRSTESLTPGDTDTQWDIYVRGAGTTTLVSAGPNGGNGPHPSRLLEASSDGSKAFFNTPESLLAADTDTRQDIYRWQNGTLTLVSVGPAGGNGPHDPVVCGADQHCKVPDPVSDAGDRVTFVTAESLVSADNDSVRDVYQWSPAGVQLVSGGGAAHDARALGKSRDHSHVFFTTQEPLLPGADTDGALYDWTSAGTSLVTNANSAVDGSLVLRVSDDGERVFFTTGDALDPADTDSVSDAYMVEDGVPTLLSTRADGTNGTVSVHLSGIASDGSRAFFQTEDKLTPADQDGDCEHQVWEDGELLYTYYAPCVDIYEGDGSTTTLVSTGPSVIQGNFDAYFQAATPDGAHVYFVTREGLVSGDANGHTDVYERATGVTTQVSVGPSGSGTGAGFDAFYGSNTSNILFVWAVAPDGSRVLFMSGENLVPADKDSLSSWRNGADWYERAGSRTTLLGHPTNDLGEAYVASTPGLEHVLIATSKANDPADADVCPNVVFPTGGCHDLYDVAVGPRQGYARPRGAAPLRLPLVPAARQCTAPNRTHGPPLSFPSCSPPASESPNLTIGVGDGSPALARGEGFVRLDLALGTPGGADESDVLIRFRLLNVMWRSNLTDYTGELETSFGVRLTDSDPGAPAYYPPTTTQDFPFTFTIPCTATASTVDGGTCDAWTSAEAVVPGSVVEGARAIWDLGQLEVTDGGPDGDVDTNDNSIFARQGVFVP